MTVCHSTLSPCVAELLSANPIPRIAPTPEVLPVKRVSASGKRNKGMPQRCSAQAALCSREVVQVVLYVQQAGSVEQRRLVHELHLMVPGLS